MPEHPYEQLTFAQYIENLPQIEVPSNTTKTKPKALAKSNKPEMPELLKNCDRTNFEVFLNTLGKRGLYNKYEGYDHRVRCMTTRYHYYIPDGNKFVGYEVNYEANGLVNTNNHIENKQMWGRFLDFPLVYFDKDGTMWSSDIHLELEHAVSRHEVETVENTIKNFSASKWKSGCKMHHNACFLQTEPELEVLVKQTNKYAYDFCKANACDFTSILMAPQLEVLHKAGYAFASRYFNVRGFHPLRGDAKALVECFNRLCKPGNNPKEIFKTSKAVCSTLKNEANIRIWDSLRKMDKFGRIKQDAIQQVYDMGFNDSDLKNLNEVLNKTYDGKPVFTFNTLVNYLNRLDMYEAIDRKEAFMLLKDYLSMCNQINQKPKLDGDSLKREHDVTARTVRQKRDEQMAREVQASCDKLQKYNYKEGLYFIRGIQNYEDLINEATQQHNCVASYAPSIKSGRSLIYVMREVNSPNRSLITVELSPVDKRIRQKFLAYNRPIHNKSQSEFLERWLKHVRAVDEGLVEPQELNFNKQSNEPILPNQVQGSGMMQTM